MDSETRYRQIVENTQDMIWFGDLADGTFTYVNPASIRICGYSAEELIGRTWKSIQPPATRDIVSDDFQRRIVALKAGDDKARNKTYETELSCKDGSTIWAEVATTLMADEAGRITQVLGVVRDISARRRTDLVMRILSQAIEQAPVSVVITNINGGIEYTNPYFTALTGYTLSEIIGLNPRFLKSGSTSARTYDEMWVTLKDGKVWRGELHNKKRNGEYFVELAVIAPVLGLNGQATHFVAIKEDITARKRTEAALAEEHKLMSQRVKERTADLHRLNSELGQAVRAKDEFLANMSHELRTPLNAILALSETLLEQLRGPLNERQQASMRNIEASGRHLLSLINDILDLSKVEAGRMELHAESIRIAELCESCLSFVKEMATKKAILLELKLNEPLAKIDADPKRLKQMLVNLLSNAVKFTEKDGRVSLEVNVDAENDAVRFAVRDTGIGIASKNMERLFQPFSQLDSSLSRQHEGTGLGLALVRRLSELHGGSVAVESEVGKGSCFTIVLPYSSRVPEAVGLYSEDPDTKLVSNWNFPRRVTARAPMRILLAEDNEFNMDAMCDYLKELNYQLVIARNGREAVSRAEETKPNLILMDIQMPVMDGLEAIRRLRAKPEFASTPIVALTALAMAGDRERCLEAGANEYMPKPVSLTGLVDTIKRLVKDERGY